jgi:hypothetical protein
MHETNLHTFVVFAVVIAYICSHCNMHETDLGSLLGRIQGQQGQNPGWKACQQMGKQRVVILSVLS